MNINDDISRCPLHPSEHVVTSEGLAILCEVCESEADDAEAKAGAEAEAEAEHEYENATGGWYQAQAEKRAADQAALDDSNTSD